MNGQPSVLTALGTGHNSSVWFWKPHLKVALQAVFSRRAPVAVNFKSSSRWVLTSPVCVDESDETGNVLQEWNIAVWCLLVWSGPADLGWRQRGNRQNDADYECAFIIAFFFFFAIARNSTLLTCEYLKKPGVKWALCFQIDHLQLLANAASNFQTLNGNSECNSPTTNLYTRILSVFILVDAVTSHMPWNSASSLFWWVVSSKKKQSVWLVLNLTKTLPTNTPVATCF